MRESTTGDGARAKASRAGAAPNDRARRSRRWFVLWSCLVFGLLVVSIGGWRQAADGVFGSEPRNVVRLGSDITFDDPLRAYPAITGQSDRGARSDDRRCGEYYVGCNLWNTLDSEGDGRPTRVDGSLISR